VGGRKGETGIVTRQEVKHASLLSCIDSTRSCEAPTVPDLDFFSPTVSLDSTGAYPVAQPESMCSSQRDALQFLTPDSCE